MSSPAQPSLRDFSDRLSPMVVKELRHGLRAHGFTIGLMLFQAGMVWVTLSGFMSTDQEFTRGFFWTVSLGAMLGYMPLRAFAMLHQETQKGTLDMLRLTSIPAFRIVAGKWLALFCQSLLFTCSVLPYLIARYFQGGMQLLLEAFLLLATLSLSAAATAAMLAFSSQASVVLRVTLCVCMYALLAPVLVVLMSAAADSGDFMLRAFYDLPLAGRAGLAGGFLFLCGYSVYVMLALGASRMAPPSEDHSSHKRKVHLGVLFLLAAGGIALILTSVRDEMFFLLYVPSFVLTLLVGMDVLTEEMPRVPTVVQGRGRRGRLGQALGRVFYPGWASGVFFYGLLLLLNLGILVAAGFRVRNSDFTLASLVYGCLLIAPLVPVLIRLNRNNPFANWWVVQVAGFGTGVVLMLFGAVTRGAMAVLGVFSPLTSVMTFPLAGFGHGTNNHESHIAMGFGFSLIWMVAALGIAWQQFQVYRQLEDQADRLDPPPAPDTPAPAPNSAGPLSAA